MPFFIVGLLFLGSAIFDVFGRTRIEVTDGAFSISRRLWGIGRVRVGETSDILKAVEVYTTSPT